MYVCMYVCMDVCMYVCMHVCLCYCLSVCLYGCMDVWMHACMHACIYIYMYRNMVCTVYGCYGTKKLAAGSSTHRHLPEFSSLGKPHFLGAKSGPCPQKVTSNFNVYSRMGWQWAWARPNMVDTRTSHKILMEKMVNYTPLDFTHSPHIKGAPQRQYQKKLGSHKGTSP